MSMTLRDVGPVKTLNRCPGGQTIHARPVLGTLPIRSGECHEKKTETNSQIWPQEHRLSFVHPLFGSRSHESLAVLGLFGVSPQNGA